MATTCAKSFGVCTPGKARGGASRVSSTAPRLVASPAAKIAESGRVILSLSAGTGMSLSRSRKFEGFIARSSSGETAVTELSIPESATVSVELGTEEAKKTILLQQIVKEGKQIIFVSAVANSSNAEEAGVVPGQILRAMSHPTRRGELWEINGDERLRYVKDGIVSRHGTEVQLWFEKDPTVTSEDVVAFTGEVEEEEEEVEEEKPAPMQPVAMSAPQQPPRERDDLYTDNWDGDQYKGSGWNELSVGLAIAIATPVLGLGFAAATYGTLWGTSSYAYLPF